jgi:CcmD family protein
MKKIAISTMFLVLATASSALAQTEMADVMRANGKIYVVVVVLATIFAGIFTYLVYLDRKISKMEKE